MYELNLILNISDLSVYKKRSLMRVANIEKIISQFRQLPQPKTDFVTFNGGDIIGTYYDNPSQYMHQCAKIASSYNFIPVFKTMATWGAFYDLRTKILHDIASAANDIKSPVGIDLYVGQKCFSANIVADIASNLYLSNAIQLSGYTIGNEQESRNQIMGFLRELNIRGLNTLRFGIDGTIIVRPGKETGFVYPIPMTPGQTNKYLKNITVDNISARKCNLNNVVQDLLQSTK